MSSVKIFVNIPGALSSLSNQPTCLCRIALKRVILSLRVRFSPPNPNETLYMNDESPIPITTIKKMIVQKFLCDTNSSIYACVSVGRAIKNIYLDRQNPNSGNERLANSEAIIPTQAIHIGL